MHYKQVLLVDDNELILKSISKALFMGGLPNIAFKHPLKALEYFKKKSDVILITDYRMPRMNGLELINQVKYINQDTTCIIYTGYPEEIDKSSLAEKDIRFFNKPLKIEILIDYIKTKQKELQ